MHYIVSDHCCSKTDDDVVQGQQNKPVSQVTTGCNAGTIGDSHTTNEVKSGWLINTLALASQSTGSPGKLTKICCKILEQRVSSMKNLQVQYINHSNQ